MVLATGVGARLRIGQLARSAGATVKAVRYYESLGLFDPPRRAPNGYRLYVAAAMGQLRFIRRAKLPEAATAGG